MLPRLLVGPTGQIDLAMSWRVSLALRVCVSIVVVLVSVLVAHAFILRFSFNAAGMFRRKRMLSPAHGGSGASGAFNFIEVACDIHDLVFGY